MSNLRRKKKTRKWLRPRLRQLLNFLERDTRVINDYLKDGRCLSEQHAIWWETIQKTYDHQQYMYENRTNSVSDRIVSFHQP
ncbi:hypothetical protein ACLI5Y_14235 [Enterococcus innesii]|uniref:hypothetical protein n=1 Tax=Enterococcus innesii TaxID=2839759 RepID=UPI0039848908